MSSASSLPWSFLSSYPYETCALALIAAYFAVYFRSAASFRWTSNQFLRSTSPFLQTHFTQVGLINPGPRDAALPTPSSRSLLLFQSTPSSFQFFASGHPRCFGVHFGLQYAPRHDLFQYLYGVVDTKNMRFTKDILTISVNLDSPSSAAFSATSLAAATGASVDFAAAAHGDDGAALDPFMFSILRKKFAEQQKKSFIEFSEFTLSPVRTSKLYSELKLKDDSTGTTRLPDLSALFAVYTDAHELDALFFDDLIIKYFLTVGHKNFYAAFYSDYNAPSAQTAHSLRVQLLLPSGSQNPDSAEWRDFTLSVEFTLTVLLDRAYKMRLSPQAFARARNVRNDKKEAKAKKEAAEKMEEMKKKKMEELKENPAELAKLKEKEKKKQQKNKFKIMR